MKTYTYTEKKDTRSGFGAGLTELGRTNPNVVALCADLIGSLKMNQFIEENPERFFQIGIAEANMMSIAAGLTIGGKIPFTGTFANFSTGRVYDQIRQSIAYSNKNVKIEHHSKYLERLNLELNGDILMIKTPEGKIQKFVEYIPANHRFHEKCLVVHIAQWFLGVALWLADCSA